MRRKKLIAHIAAVLLATTPLTPTFAHAFPDHSAPAVGGTIAQSPADVRIWFTQKLELSFSSIKILDASGARVDRDDTHVDAQNPTLLRVSVKPLAAGTYKVMWHVVSADTHTTDGSFSLTIRT